jgi:hypothetical protein
VPKPFPAEFRRDVVAVARKGEASLAHIARDVEISESCLACRPWIADREDGLAPAAAGDRVAGPRTSPRSCGTCAGATSCSSRRTRCCGGRLRRSPATSSQRDLPVVRELAAEQIPVAVTCRILGFSAGLLQVVRQSGESARLGGRASDQRRGRHPPRRSGLRLPVHRRPAGCRREVGRSRLSTASLRNTWRTLESPCGDCQLSHGPGVRRPGQMQETL